MKIFNLILAIFAIGISIISLSLDCNQNKKISKLTDQTNAMQYRPTLKIIRGTVIDSFTVLPEKEVVRIDKKEKNDDTISYYFNIKVWTTLKIYNNSDFIANIKSVSILDTNSGKPIIRQFFSDNNSKENKIRIKPFENFYPTLQIPKRDTISLNISGYNIVFFSKNIATLHFLILYENEIGTLYDSYYWVRLKLEPSKFNVQSFYNKKEKYLKMIYHYGKDFITEFESDYVSKTYSRNEKNIIYNVLKGDSK